MTIDVIKSAVDQFKDAIAQKGITPPDTIIPDGLPHRFSSSGEPDDTAGWYVFREGEIATGSFGDFRSSQTVAKWVADVGHVLTPEEKSYFRQKQEEARRQREADIALRRTEAIAKGNYIIRVSIDAPNDHPYLLNKGVGSYGLMLWKDLLVVPMIDITGQVQSLQMISADGQKKFLSGGKMQGCYFPIGDIAKAATILIAEGYATAATLYEANNLPTIVAFNAGNLVHVAKSIREQYPTASIIICADDDIKTVGNPGLTKATEAAELVGGKVITPYFSNDRPDGMTDFNDMAALLGIEAVAARFINRSLDIGYRMPVIPQMRPPIRPRINPGI